ALRLIMDALKLQPVRPSFIDARDAILAADRALTGGANQLEIWTAFARRGLGFSARTANANSGTVTLAFDIPALGLAVTSSVPAHGDIITTRPTSFVLNFSDAVRPSTVDASALRVNGIAANSFTLSSGNRQVTFSYTVSPVTAEGVQTMTMDAGAILRASDGSPVRAFTATFRYTALRLQVTATTPPDGSVVSLPFTSLLVSFNRAFDPATVGTGNLSLSQGTVTAATMVDATTIQYTLAGLTDEGTLT